MIVKCPKCRFKYEMPVAPDTKELACVCSRCGFPFSYVVPEDAQSEAQIPQEMMVESHLPSVYNKRYNNYQLNKNNQHNIIIKEKKECPYCGEEILITAKKCKHCGEWLDINNEGVNLDNSQLQGDTYESLNDNYKKQNTLGNAFQKDGYNEENKNALPVQFIIISIILGIYYKSWWVGIGTFIGLSILIILPYVGNIICFLLSILYARIGYELGSYFFTNNVGWVIAFITGFGSLGINLNSKNWLKNIM